MKIKFIISLIISFLCFNYNFVTAEEQVHEKDKEAYHLFFIHKKNLDTLITKAKNLKLTEENFLLLCELFKIQHPKFVLKQAIIESGGFKSNVFNKTNNMFGMKVPLRRRTYALKGKKYTNTQNLHRRFFCKVNSGRTKKLLVYNYSRGNGIFVHV